MGIIDDVLRSLGVSSLRVGSSRKSKRGQNPLGLPDLPSPSEIQQGVEQIIEGASKLKEIPKDLASRLSEAGDDFQEADKAIRGSRVRTGKRRD